MNNINNFNSHLSCNVATLTEQPQLNLIDRTNKTEILPEETGLNKYGDPISTRYMGGTPLFDESSAKRISIDEYRSRKMQKKIPNRLIEIIEKFLKRRKEKCQPPHIPEKWRISKPC